ncbi:MAG: hypothetical protein ABEH56_03700 [Salinirussus sp.]
MARRDRLLTAAYFALLFVGFFALPVGGSGIIRTLLVVGIFAPIVLWAVHRLTVVAKAARALRRTPVSDVTRVETDRPAAIEGQAFVDEPAPVSERLFDPTTAAVGAYAWQAWKPDIGRNTFDSDRGEFRAGRGTFASGMEAGRVGVTVDGQPVYFDPSWLRQVHDSDSLPELEVGNPWLLPSFFTRHLVDSNYVSLESTIGDCPIDRLTDVVSVTEDDAPIEEFNIEARGITAGQRIFLHGEIREDDGEYTLVGTGETPLLVADTGHEGFKRYLLWRGVKYTVVLLAAAGLGALFVL